MDTKVKIFKCDASQTSPEAILSSGETFSGSIYFNEETRHIFESLLNYSPKKQYEDIQWICHDGPCLFIPKPLFSESKLQEYWQFFAPKSSNGKLVYDQNEVQKLILMYEERPLVFDYLKAHAKTLERTHYHKTLYLSLIHI